MVEHGKSKAKAFLASIATDWANGFSDLAWKSRPLVLSADGPVVKIRLELQEEECFHLQGVKIYSAVGGGTKALSLDNVVVHLSSCYINTPQLGDGRVFLNNSGTGLGFHTARQHNPWIEITFPVPIRDVSILLFNRDDEFSTRARTLKVSFDDGTRHQTLYDAISRHCTLHSWIIQRHLEMFGELPDDETRPVVKFVRMLAFSEFHSCNQLLKSNAHFVSLRSEINAIAKMYSREFTIHGLFRSFRYWRIDEKQNYLAYSKTVLQAVREISDNTCYGFGFALGYVRDGDFIAHDDDVDILVAFDIATVPTLSEALRLVEEHLRAKGFSVEGNFISHRWVSTANGLVDVFVGLIEADGKLSFYPARRNCYKSTDVFPAQEVNFLGTRLPMPRNLPAYLENTYGDSWRRSDNEFRHPWDESSYSDIS